MIYVSQANVSMELQVTSATNNVVIYNTTSKQIEYNSSTSKTFVIDHPLEKNKYLVHACLEGPEAGVYYRGKGEIKENDCTTIILPSYVSSLAKNFTIHITLIYEPINKNKIYEASELIDNNSFNVYGPKGKFYWIVYGERLYIETEPNKFETTVKGSGPYLYI